MPSTKKPALPPAAHQRLLEAAARVFARDGLDGATTREIAREASVNEVTLFRHFKSKERLLAAVVGEACGTTLVLQGVLPSPTGDLRADLLALAEFYDRMLTANLPLVRTMLGEIQRHKEHERKVFKAIFLPLRDALLSHLDAARTAGTMRSDLDKEILADLFTSMVFMGVLRRNSPHIHRQYTPSDYLAATVDVLMAQALSQPH